jgi:hypothetical protein
MRFRIFLIVLGVIVGVGSFGSFAEPVAEAKQLQPRVLIVFKNGLSWIEHRGEVALTNGWGLIPAIPDAAFGTVSLTSDEAKVDEVRTTGGLQGAAGGGPTLESILASGAGRMVTLRVGDRDVSGRLVSSGQRPSGDAELFQRNARDEPLGVILVASDGKLTAIPRHLITAVTFDGDALPKDDRATPSLRFHVAESSASAAPVRLSYVRPGIGWFPDYSITLDGDGRAALTMRATLVDDGEDLRDTDVFFAVGVPNFAFGTVESPLSARQSLAELFRALGQGAVEVFSAMANTMNNVAMPNTRRTTGSDAMPTEGTSGESTEDFFFYSRKGITLARGERAAFPLLEASVKYSDLYTLDIPRDAANETVDKVWHSIRLQNPTKLPWTTAPALVIAGGRPVAQETLQYTPANGETTLRLTVANSIVVDRHEAEAARQRESVRRFDNTWDAVTIEGTIDIRNFKDEPVVLAITREVEGEAIRTRDHRVTRIATTPRAMNPVERLEWEIPLRAGEQKTIKYQYKVFVRE